MRPTRSTTDRGNISLEAHMRKTLAVVATSGFILLAPTAIASAEPLTAGVTQAVLADEDVDVDAPDVDVPDVGVEDEGDKTGLWGLLGLLGLAGLAKRKVKDDDHTHR